MASGIAAGERRGAPRIAAGDTPWQRVALLRPGREVVLVNLSPGGALIESHARLSPGARTELQLFGGAKRTVRGRVARCRVLRLEPLCYEGAIAFDECLELPGTEERCG